MSKQISTVVRKIGSTAAPQAAASSALAKAASQLTVEASRGDAAAHFAELFEGLEDPVIRATLTLEILEDLEDTTPSPEEGVGHPIAADADKGKSDVPEEIMTLGGVEEKGSPARERSSDVPPEIMTTADTGDEKASTRPADEGVGHPIAADKDRQVGEES